MILESKYVIDDDKYIKMSITVPDEAIADKKSAQKELDKWVGFLLLTTLGMSKFGDAWEHVKDGFLKVVEIEAKRMKKLIEDL